MERRISFLVHDAQPTPDGWLVHGEPALGPPAPGHLFAAVHHEAEGSEDPAALLVAAVDGDTMRVVGNTDVSLSAGDILIGVVDR